MFKRLFVVLLMLCACASGYSQGKLSIDNVGAGYLRSSGTIVENNQTKGYFFLYVSDKINRRTNEYTLQILDQNVNKVIVIKFQDSKQLNLLEAAYNNASLAFLFRNDDSKTLDLKIYDPGGKLQYTYSRNFGKRTGRLLSENRVLHTDEAINKKIFDLGGYGYASVYPVCNGKAISYALDFYSSQTNSIWTYAPVEDKESYAYAKYLGISDSLIILQVLKKNEKSGKKVEPQIVAINFISRKKAFEINGASDDKVLLPSCLINMKERNKMLLLGNYFEKNDKVLNDYSRGIAIYEISNNGMVLSRKYNSWAGDFASSPAGTQKGKLHNLIQSNGKLFVVGGLYEKKESDIIMMELNNEYNIANATIYNEANYYRFTTGDNDNSNFTVCYSDYVRNNEYKEQSFKSIRYNGERFITDKIELKSKATRMMVLPAKMGAVMIVEYFKKTKKLEFRIEKLG